MLADQIEITTFGDVAAQYLSAPASYDLEFDMFYDGHVPEIGESITVDFTFGDTHYAGTARVCTSELVAPVDGLVTVHLLVRSESGFVTWREGE